MVSARGETQMCPTCYSFSLRIHVRVYVCVLMEKPLRSHIDLEDIQASVFTQPFPGGFYSCYSLTCTRARSHMQDSDAHT